MPHSKPMNPIAAHRIELFSRPIMLRLFIRGYKALPVEAKPHFVEGEIKTIVAPLPLG